MAEVLNLNNASSETDEIGSNLSIVVDIYQLTTYDEALLVIEKVRIKMLTKWAEGNRDQIDDKEWRAEALNLEVAERFLRKANGEHESTLSKLTSLKKDMLSMKKKIEDLDTKIEDLDTKIEDLDTKIEDLDTKFEDLDTKFEDLDTKFEDLDTEIEDLVTAFKILKQNELRNRVLADNADLILLLRFYVVEDVIGCKWREFANRYGDMEDDVHEGKISQADFDLFVTPLNAKMPNGIDLHVLVKSARTRNTTVHQNISSRVCQTEFLNSVKAFIADPETVAAVDSDTLTLSRSMLTELEKKTLKPYC